MRRFANLQSNSICLGLTLMAVALIVLGVMMAVLPQPVLANSSDKANAIAKYPHLDGETLECELCHTSYGSRKLNDYGLAYKSGGRNITALTNLENLDTDGDDYLNIIEINALTSPGNSDDYPHDDALARYYYPNIVDERLDDCALCHSTGTNLNPYGIDYQAQGGDLAAFALIESLDSDDDGFSNIAEINELTFPGDDGDHPTVENQDMTLAREAYPALVGTQLDSCNLCHTTGAALNNYGQDYLAGGRDAAAFGVIETFDSDSDDFSNLEEITQLTFPGDPDDPHDNFLAIKQYPALSGSRLDTCTLCHTDSIGSALNPYGTDYYTYGHDLAAFGLIEAIDSDGDTFTNLEEINELTFPGNASDSPAAQHNHETLIIQQYAIDGTRLAVPDTCDMCHNADLTLNVYGADYAGTTPPYDFAAIETIDSDGDDFTNLEEILQLTFPGDDSDPHDDARALKQYPDLAGTPLDTCTLCHTDSVGTALNPYGTDYRNDGRNLAAFAAIEDDDSDGDDFTNLEEILQLTFPGNDGDPHDDARALKKYPELDDTRLDACTLCHTDSSGTGLNVYGTDYRDSGRNLAAFDLIQNLDSDEDTYSNIDEIDQLTFPGNASDMPGAEHNYETLLVQQYPTINGTRLTTPDTCDVCHNTGETTLNAYGSDYAAGFDFAALENIDSDNDEFVNIDEIELFFYPGNATDHPEDLDLVLSLYAGLPEIESHGCHLCHTDESSPDLNSYGAAYLSNGRSRAALVAIENLDSDGDGYCNLEELELGYCPGEIECPTHSESLLIQYPNVEGTRLESCDLCHDYSAPGDWRYYFNPYGEDYIAAGSNATAFGAIEALDSDGDGYLNIEEIQALAMPGDATDIPAQSGGTNFVFLPIILK